jgi:hypothetical protein
LTALSWPSHNMAVASSPRAAAKAHGWNVRNMEFVRRKSFTAEAQRPQRSEELSFGVFFLES